jgi:hypothetical protein
MPDPARILEGLATIANAQGLMAVVWHVILAAIVVSLLLGWRPPKRLSATDLAIPLLSVSLMAWHYGNPFNGAVFLVFAVTLAWIGLRLPPTRVEKAPAWAVAIGTMMVVFGWVYPHFLEGAPLWTYLYRAPTGLIPCPTLSVVVGLALLAKGFSSRAWSLVLGVLGVFYGFFGAFRLGVRIDLALAAGSIVLLVMAGMLRPRAKA